MAIKFYQIAGTDKFVIGSREMIASGYGKVWHENNTLMGVVHNTSFLELVPPQTYDEYLKENGDPYASFDELLTAVAGFFNRVILQHGGMTLTTQPAISLDDADTYYRIEGVWGGLATPYNFEVDVLNHRLYYRGINDVSFLISGSSDVKSSKVSVVTYALYKNGALVPGAESPHTFGTAQSIEHLSITDFTDLQNGDYIEVWAKSTVDNTIITPQSLNITLLGTL